jgi:hypothetical protein
VQRECVDVLKEWIVEGEGGGSTLRKQRSSDLQESTTRQKSAVCILGENKFAPNFVALVASYIYIYIYIYIYVVRHFKDLTARHTNMSFGS